MLIMNQANFVFSGDSKNDNEEIAANMSANCIGNSIYFALTINDYSKDSATVTEDFVTFKNNVMNIINQMPTEEAQSEEIVNPET